MKSTFRARLVAPNSGLDELNLIANIFEIERRLSAAGGFCSKYRVVSTSNFGESPFTLKLFLPSGGQLECLLESGVTRPIEFLGCLTGSANEQSECVRFMAVIASAYQVNDSCTPPVVDLWPGHFHDLPDEKLAVVIQQLRSRFDYADKSRAGLLRTMPSLEDLGIPQEPQNVTLDSLINKMCMGW